METKIVTKNLYHTFTITLIIEFANLIMFIINAQSLQQRFAIEPSDKTAIVGDTVVFPCRVINKVGTLQWTKDGFGLGTERQLSGFPRYTMIGTDEEGDYSLQIANVQLEDDAEFQCQVGAVDGVRGLRSRNAAFTVFVPPDEPLIVQSRAVGEVLKTTAGTSIELSCESNGGKPPAEITWIDGDTTVKSGTQYSNKLTSDGKRFNSVRKWTFTATREHNGRTLTCRSENSALKTPMKTHIRLEVKYSPEIKLNIESHSKIDQNILIGDDVYFRCNATANPDHLIYKWYMNDEIIVGDHTTRMVLYKVTKSMNGATIVCEVANNVGTSRAKHVLKIHYGPTFKSPIEHVIGTELGKDVTMSCIAEGNPPPEITWLFEGSPNVLNTGKDLTVRNVNKEKIGKYICRASVKGFPEIRASVVLYLKGPPKIKGPDIQYGTEGESATIMCHIESVPPPSKIIWNHNSMNVDVDNNEGYEIIEEPIHRESIVRSMIVIHKSKSDDFGEYNCSVWNNYGFDSRIITLVHETSMASLLLTVGIIIICIVTVVMVTIVAILCLKRKSLNDGDSVYQSDYKKGHDSMTTSSSPHKHHVTDTGSSGADSDIKVEIRTASSLSQQWDDSGGHSDADGHGMTANEISRVAENIYSYTNNYNFNTPLNNEDVIPNVNGYVTRLDLNDYLQSENKIVDRPSIIVPSDNGNSYFDSTYGSIIDGRYRTSYSNPYLRSSMTSNIPTLSIGPSGGQFYAISGSGHHVELKEIGSDHSMATHV